LASSLQAPPLFEGCYIAIKERQLTGEPLTSETEGRSAKSILTLAVCSASSSGSDSHIIFSSFDFDFFVLDRTSVRDFDFENRAKAVLPRATKSVFGSIKFVNYDLYSRKKKRVGPGAGGSDEDLRFGRIEST
jgi:hypothetical protein